jgi:hypothetical protein
MEKQNKDLKKMLFDIIAIILTKKWKNNFNQLTFKKNWTSILLLIHWLLPLFVKLEIIALEKLINFSFNWSFLPIYYSKCFV